jgi:hypothetical protein
MQQAEQTIDELLDWTDETPAPNLTQIEDIILALRQRLSEQMAQEVIEAQAASPRRVLFPLWSGDALQRRQDGQAPHLGRGC